MKEKRCYAGYTISDLIDELHEQKNIVKEGFRNKEVFRNEDGESEEDVKEMTENYDALSNAMNALIQEVEQIGYTDVSKFEGIASLMVDYGESLGFDRLIMLKLLDNVFDENLS